MNIYEYSSDTTSPLQFQFTASVLKGQDSQTLSVLRSRGKDKTRHPLCLCIYPSSIQYIDLLIQHKSPAEPSPGGLGHGLGTRD